MEKKSKRTILQKLIIKYFCLKFVDKFLFIGKGSTATLLTNLVILSIKCTTPLVSIQIFGVIKISSNLMIEYILFVGNDLNRDFDFLIDLVKELKKEKFVIVSSQFDESIKTYNNVEYINGKWSENSLSDEEIRSLYSKAKLTIIPLKHTLQPSGQSVALQAMSCLSPVLITKTAGFWDIDKFEDGKNIYFMNKNDINEWVKKINFIFQDSNLKNITNNAQLMVEQNFSVDTFATSCKYLEFLCNFKYKVVILFFISFEIIFKGYCILSFKPNALKPNYSICKFFNLSLIKIGCLSIFIL